MQIVRNKCQPAWTTLSSVDYGNVVAIAAFPDRLYMYVKTSQIEVNIVKSEAIARKWSQTHKLLDLSTGYIKCVPTDTPVRIVDAVVCVQED